MTKLVRLIAAADRWEMTRAKAALHDATPADYKKFGRACDELAVAVRSWRKSR